MTAMQIIPALPSMWVAAFFESPFYTTLGTCAAVWAACVAANTISSICWVWSR